MSRLIYRVIFLGVLLAYGSSSMGQTYLYTYTVTKTTDPDPFLTNFDNDDSKCDPQLLGTLQWALLKARYSNGHCRINFNIPGVAPHQIDMKYYIPLIFPEETDIIIDGSTQPANGYTGSEPKVIINSYNGTVINCFVSIGYYNGNISQNVDQYVTIKDLTFTRFNCPIHMRSSSHHTIVNNVFRNLIINNSTVWNGLTSGAARGIDFIRSDYVTIQNNIFGTDRSRVPNYGWNGLGLISLISNYGLIGGTGPGEKNEYYNIGAPVDIGTDQLNNGHYNKVSGELMKNIKWYGIFLGYNSSGIAGNDSHQPPVIQNVLAGSISGTTYPNDFVEVFKTDMSVGIDALQYMGTAQANASGNWTLSNPSISIYSRYNATTRDANNNTSEFSPPTSLVVECCESTFPLNIPATGGTPYMGAFYFDEDKGKFVYKQSSASTSTFSFTCISGNGIDKVVNANALTFSNTWLAPNSTSTNPYETGEKGKWRVSANYTYRDGINKEGENRNYNQGRFPLTIFNWTGGAVDAKWVNTGTNDKYSPNGEPVEDHNILNIHSTAKYGYNNTLMVLSAQNAADHSVGFESFENIYPVGSPLYFEDNLPISSGGVRVARSTTNKVHTGFYAVKLNQNQLFSIASIALNAEISLHGGLLVRVWLSAPAGVSIDGKVKANDGNVDYDMRRVSSSGEWSLYETIISSVVSTGSLDVKVKVNEQNVYMDDTRVQPVESEMTCYVYDKAQRIIAVLDDQHYAMLFEYNAEGLLIRKLKETTDGIKTISSADYNNRGTLR